MHLIPNNISCRAFSIVKLLTVLPLLNRLCLLTRTLIFLSNILADFVFNYKKYQWHVLNVPFARIVYISAYLCVCSKHEITNHCWYEKTQFYDISGFPNEKTLRQVQRHFNTMPMMDKADLRQTFRWKCI